MARTSRTVKKHATFGGASNGVARTNANILADASRTHDAMRMHMCPRARHHDRAQHSVTLVAAHANAWPQAPVLASALL